LAFFANNQQTLVLALISYVLYFANNQQTLVLALISYVL